MDTLNVKQLRALSIVAPGTLAIRETTPMVATLLVAEDDRIRTGVWMIEVYDSGNVSLHVDNGRVLMSTYGELLRREAEARLERELEATYAALLGA